MPSNLTTDLVSHLVTTEENLKKKTIQVELRN